MYSLFANMTNLFRIFSLFCFNYILETHPYKLHIGLHFYFGVVCFCFCQLCITLNNIEHVREYLDNLPRLLEWNKTIQDLAKEHNDLLAGKRTLDSLHKLANKASTDVLTMSSLLESKIADRMCREVSKFMDKVINPCEQNDEEVSASMGWGGRELHLCPDY